MDKLLYKVLENSLNGIIAYEAIRDSNAQITDFKFLYLNQSAEKLIKRNRQELLTSTLIKEFKGIQHGELFGKFVYTTNSGESQIVEFYYNADNINTWFRGSLVKLEDGIVFTFIDIKEEVNKEKQVNEIQEILKETFELSHIGVYEWNLAQNKIYWSDQLFRIYGYQPNEFTVTPYLHLQIIHPDDRQFISDLNRNLFKEPAHEYKYYYRFIRKDGSVGIGVGKGKSFTDENGKFYKMRGYVQDISERKKTENLLTETQEMGHIGSFEWDIQKNIITGTPEYYKIFEIEKEPVPFEGILNKIHPEDRSIISKDILNTKLTDETEFRIVLKNGSVRHMWSRVKVYNDKNNSPISMIGLVMDITELRMAREKLEKLNAELEERIIERTKALSQSNENLKKINEELDRFAYVISHDLKSPLGSIEGLILGIEDEMKNKISDDTFQMLEMAIERVHHMAEMINGLLQNARGQNRKKEQIDLKQLVKEVIANLEIPSELHLHIQPDMPVIHFHKLSMIQIFQNLIGNSVKYMDKPNGIVKIGFEKMESEIVFCVSDNGPGISKTSQEKIFNLFETGDTTPKKESTGIGLSIVKKLVEENKGRIWLESEMGKGSTFYFSVPLTISQ